MTNLLFYLSTCSTCNRIIKKIDPRGKLKLQDIKTEPVTTQQLDEMKGFAGSYDALFSRRAMKYKTLGLNKKELSENEIKNLILEEYTFLKRPVLVLDHQIYIGNSKKTVTAMKAVLEA